ncbi:MAG: dinitrogenase iron-molybdenum cofactor biosynthesis protein [Bacteroidales bacterium]|nr:dinitrogenase iron-molybdenum cofactor biosynthesis protein [Bacteroidales bacterium]
MVFNVVIPTRDGGFVDEHFGHCEYFTLYKVDDEKKTILSKERLDSPEGCGCKSNIIHTFLEKEVDVMLAGGIGGGAVAMLESSGIGVFNGCCGNTDEVVMQFLNGQVCSQGACCSAHHDGCHHDCH